MTKKYDTLVYIGRFQPLHSAHQEIIRKALTLTKELIILVGSTDLPRTFKNPFTFAERKMMINNTLNIIGDNITRVHIVPLVDYLYSDTKWAVQVQGEVSKYRVLGGRIGIIGHRKIDTTYLDMFPQWELEEIDLIEPLHATDIRELYFKRNPNLNFLKNVVNSAVFNLLQGWVGSPDWEQVVREREFIDDYKSQFAGMKYPPIFVTSDAIVTCAGHVLLIKRRAEPGKGLLAVPGGFVNAYTDASVEDACIRELREETKIKVPEPVLRGSIKGKNVFDAVNRSARGRTITHAFYIQLESKTLPKVVGSDDAEKAVWLPLSEVRRDQMFDDHWDMIEYFTKV